jgi:hypothetical protein
VLRDGVPTTLTAMDRLENATFGLLTVLETFHPNVRG